MTTLVKLDLNTPIESRQDLIDYLARGARPQEAWGIGSEMEKLVVDAETGEAASYPRIEEFLEKLESSGGWRGIRESGHLIALLDSTSSITLEPGGQLELSGRICRDIHCSDRELKTHIGRILAEAEPLGLRFLGLGVQPFTPLGRIDWLPKARYGIMGPYMERTCSMGQAMMKQSAGLQVNLDYSDEQDCISKLRIALALSPLLYALFANSPIQNGRPSGFLSTRGEIWGHTDPDRTGLIPQIFEEGAGFATYVEYALDVPMYFLIRDEKLVNLTGERFSFRRYLSEGFAGHRATLTDWDLHLSTLFPEARLRPQIEVRSADSLPPSLTPAVAALLKGLLYDADARQEVWSIFCGQSQQERQELYELSWRHGLRTPMGKGTLREVALETLDIARRGLLRQGQSASGGPDETSFLEGIEEIAESGITLAERLLANWKGSRSDKVAALIAHCGFHR